jgi:hypothetical protein
MAEQATNGEVAVDQQPQDEAMISAAAAVTPCPTSTRLPSPPRQ